MEENFPVNDDVTFSSSLRAKDGTIEVEMIVVDDPLHGCKMLTIANHPSGYTVAVRGGTKQLGRSTECWRFR